MATDVTLDNFHGPLDLLLQLIEAKEMDITTVSLSSVTEQFLSYLAQIEEHRPEELADFLVVATRLLLLKSYALLPYLYPEAEDDPRELEAQLRMYKTYAQATTQIAAQWERGAILYARKQSLQQAAFRPPVSVSQTSLRDLYLEVLSRLEPVVRIPKSAYAQVITLREKLSQIHDMLEKNVMMHFQELVAHGADRGEVVVTFLAVLELVKQQSVIVKQDHSFSDFIIEKVSV